MKGKIYTMKDVSRMIVIQSIIDKKRTGKEVSEVLDLSERQIWRLVKKAKDKGIDNLKHGNCNKIPKNKVTDDIINKIVEYKQKRYKVVCIDNVPNKYSTLNLNKICKEHEKKVKEFATSLCNYNSKEHDPLLTSS